MIHAILWTLAIWAIGALAAYPACFELSEDDDLDRLGQTLCGVLLAAVWPAAWVSLIWWTAKKAAKVGSARPRS